MIILTWVLVLSLPSTVLAKVEPIHFEMTPQQSSIAFMATQNDEPATGGFSVFSADIVFHPEALDASKVRVEVDMGSVTGAYQQVPATLKMEDWFHVAAFPKAVFETQSFKSLGGNRYEAAARLTIKGQSVPLTLNFTLDQFSDTAAHVTGKAMIKRSSYHIGWNETSTLKDEVEVQINLSAVAKH